MKIPGFVLKKLYVPGSLRADAAGLRFTLKNTLATATLTELRSLHVDGAEVAPSRVAARLEGADVDLEAVSKDRPLAFPRSASMEILVQGQGAGPRAKVRLEVVSAEFGDLVVDFEDAATS